jgi:hypothetical protein
VRPAREFLNQLDSTPEAKTFEVLVKRKGRCNIGTREIALQYVYYKQAASRSAGGVRVREILDGEPATRKRDLKTELQKSLRMADDTGFNERSSFGWAHCLLLDRVAIRDAVLAV